MLEVEAVLSESGERDAFLLGGVEEERVAAEVESGERVADVLGGDELVEHVLIGRGEVGAEYAESGVFAARARHIATVHANARPRGPRQAGHVAPLLAHFAHTK